MQECLESMAVTHSAKFYANHIYFTHETIWQQSMVVVKLRILIDKPVCHYLTISQRVSVPIDPSCK